MESKRLIERVTMLIAQGEEVLSTQRRDSYREFVDSGKFTGFRSASLSFINMIYGTNSSYYKEFDRLVNYEYPK